MKLTETAKTKKNSGKMFEVEIRVKFQCFQCIDSNRNYMIGMLKNMNYSPRLITTAKGCYIKLGNAKNADRIYLNDFLIMDGNGLVDIVPEKDFDAYWTV